MFTQTSTRERITRRGTLPPLPRCAPVRSASRASGRTPSMAWRPASSAGPRPAVAHRRLGVRSKERVAPSRAQPRLHTSLPPRRPDAWPRGAAGCTAREPRHCRITPVATRSGRSAVGSTACEGGGGGPTTGSAAGEVRREQLWRDEHRRDVAEKTEQAGRV
jgi:hypothetical protein